MESTGLERIVVVADGAIKAHFCDGTLLLLSPKGEFYEHVSDDGSPARHLINCALRRHSQRLRQVLAFRNLYFRDSIYTSWVMEDDSRSRSSDIPYSVPPQWPATVQEGLDQGLICLSGALVSLRSVDGVHRIVYDTIGRRLSVSYPQKIPIGTGEGKSQSILEDKVFSVHDVPNEWIPPLRVTLAAYKRFFDLGIEDLKELGEIERAIAFREGTTADSTSHLTESRRLDFKSSWWYSNTTIMPEGEQIALEWTENVLYQFIGSTNEAQAWIRQDDSYLETVKNGRFVRHRSARFDRLYAASATPSDVASPESEVLYSVASIVEHLCAIRNLGSQIDKQRSSKPDRVPLISAQIHEEQITSAGVFTAYTDGRIRVNFADRTLLQLDSSGEMCDLISAAGERHTLSCACPVEFKSHILAARNYRLWAFGSDSERAAIEKTREEIERVSLKCRLNAAYCRWQWQKASKRLL